MIENRGNVGPEQLDKVTSNIIDEGNSTGLLRGMFSTSRADTPWLNLELDRSKCLALGVQVTDVFNTLQVYLGSYYVNNFNQFGRTWQVNVQADANFRDQAHDIKKLQVRNQQGNMIPLGSLLTIHGQSGPVAVLRYNLYSSAAVLGTSVPGTSSGQAISLMEKIADRNLPRGLMARDWTELTYLQKGAGNTALFVFGLAVMFVFLVLAAQYESWSLPLAVILVVPMCLLCSITVVVLAGLEVNIFTQIGFVVLVGLAGKNAILIVEVAKQKQEAGAAPRGSFGGIAAAAAAHPHDLVRVHPGRRSAGCLDRCRRRDASGPWFGGLQRHVGGNFLWNFPDARFLLRAPAPRLVSHRGGNFPR